MNEIEVRNEYDMLKGNINRMFLADDVKELLIMYDFAKQRIEKIYEYNYASLNNI